MISYCCSNSSLPQFNFSFFLVAVPLSESEKPGFGLPWYIYLFNLPKCCPVTFCPASHSGADTLCLPAPTFCSPTPGPITCAGLPPCMNPLFTPLHSDFSFRAVSSNANPAHLDQALTPVPSSPSSPMQGSLLMPPGLLNFTL